jgi:ABC-type multidrug transport system fused ATPase/permease subunit
MRSGEHAGTARSPASYLRILARFVATYARPTPLLLVLGTLSAIAETLGITLVVLFLFSALGNPAEAAAWDNLLSTIFLTVNSLVGGDTTAVGVLIFLSLVAKALLSFAYGALTVSVRHAVGKRVRQELFRQYMTVSFDYVRRHEEGELVNILAYESESIADAYYSLTRIAINACAIAFFLAFLLAISWEITAIAAAGAAVVFGIRRRLSLPARKLGEEATMAKNDLTERIMIAIQSMRTIRTFAQEGRLEQRFDRASERVRRTSVALEHLQHLIPPLSESGYLAVLGVVIVASTQLEVPFAATLAAVALLYRLQPHMRELDSSLLELGGIEASIRLVGGVLDRSDKNYPPGGTVPFGGLETELRFENVSMAYAGGQRAVLRDATFSIPAGQTTAIVGRSGAGKTTIVNLILRLYEPTSGTIIANGRPISSFERRSWLSRIAIAGQDLELIEGTIAENIAFGRTEAPMDDIEQAAGLAGVLNFAADLPDGIHARVGERGLNLSAGQRQRVALARALFRKPDLLILDEATTALDEPLEAEIRRNIMEVFRGTTIVVITHRMEIARSADHMVKITRGGHTVEAKAAHERQAS